MEQFVGGERRRVAMNRESILERERERNHGPRALRRIEIVYYLSRNGQLEHPHFMELSQLPNQQLTLKDVTEKLSLLRGRGMPALFAWSCKRSYKNGYVWNDLSEDDVIYPADGAEYVLKGSEIIPGCASEQFRQLGLRNRRPKPLSTQRRQDEDEDDDDEDTEKDIAPNNSHCSRRVSTENNAVVNKPPRSAQTEITVEDGSPALSSSSSDPAAAEAATGLTRNSIFLQLIACGSAASAKGGRKSGNLHAGVVSRAAVAAAANHADEEDQEFGRLKGIEDKEYFSGSIVEVIRKPADQPKLKRSSSFDEQRGSKVGLEEERLEVGEEREGVKGKCIPGRKRSSFKLLQTNK